MRNATRIAATVASAGLIAAAMAAPASAKPAAPKPTIVDVATSVNSATGLFDTVLAAATCDYFEGAIVNALSARGQRTLFAPTDDAFGALGLNPGNVCSSFAADPSSLADVLTYHVTNGRRDASSVLGATSMRMLNGDRVQVDAPNVALVDGKDRVANIIVTDVPATNGIIHAIDSVLLPPGFGA